MTEPATTASAASATTGPSRGLPPGPRLSRLVQTLLFLPGRHLLSPYLRRRYGHTFTLRIAQNRTIMVITRPADIRAVFAGSPSVFHAGEGNAILAPVMGRSSVLILDEDAHLTARRRLMPAFNGAALRGYGDMMTALAEQFAEDWPQDSTFAVHERMNAVTLEIILRVVFGITDGERLTQLRPRIRTLVSIGAIAVLGWANPKLQRHRPWRRNAENLAAVDELIYAEIADRRATDLDARTDVLSRLLVADPEQSDTELRDHLMTLLLAGHETTATALAWSLHELARNPVVRARAQQAADDGDDDYLVAVAKEAMRLRPVIYMVARRLTEDTEVAGWLVPKGTIVSPSIGLVQVDPEQHAEPTEFRPERFLGSGPETGTWIPFGGGVRRCLGAGFSLQEAAAVLRAVLSRYDVTAPTAAPERAKARNITLVPAKGARIMVSRRR